MPLLNARQPYQWRKFQTNIFDRLFTNIQALVILIFWLFLAYSTEQAARGFINNLETYKHILTQEDMKKAFFIQNSDSPSLKQRFVQHVTNARLWIADYMEVLLQSSRCGTGKAVKNCEVHLFAVSCFP